MSGSFLANYRSAAGFARALVRWNEWYDTKIPMFLVCMYYASLSRPRLDARLAGEICLLTGLLCVYAAFGHMVNDLSDRGADRAAGKRNVLATLSERRAQSRLWRGSGGAGCTAPVLSS